MYRIVPDTKTKMPFTNKAIELSGALLSPMTDQIDGDNTKRKLRKVNAYTQSSSKNTSKLKILPSTDEVMLEYNEVITGLKTSTCSKFSQIPKCNNESITVETSSDAEIIDTSILEKPSVFDWIRTPRSARSRRKFFLSSQDVTSVSKSPKWSEKTSPLRNKAIDLNDKTIFKQNRVKTSKATTEKESPMQISFIKRNSQPTLSSPKGSHVSSVPVKLLEGSKRRNVEAWLVESASQPVTTPPMSLSPSQRNPLTRTPNNSPSKLDPEVKEVLQAVYGEHWKEKAFKRNKTESKKTRFRNQTPSAGSTKNSKKRKSSGSNDNWKNTSYSDENVLESRYVRRRIFYDNAPPGEKKYETSYELGIDCLDKTLSPGLAAISPTRAQIKRKKISTSTHDPASVPTTPKTVTNSVKTPRRTFLASLSSSTPTSISHPDAQLYKLNFAKTRDELCSRLFKLYNTEVFNSQLPEDMSVKWNIKMRGTAGYCFTKRKKSRTGLLRRARIELSARVVDRADRLRDTLIHEMCHAAAWIIDGIMDGHGAVWSSWVARALSRFPELPPIRRCHNYQIATKYTYRCTVCGYAINRQSRSIDTERKRCGHCLGVLELLFNKKKRGATEAPEFEATRTLRAPNAFALFVKENYKPIKEKNPEKKHGEIMKLISEQYAIYKRIATPIRDS